MRLDAPLYAPWMHLLWGNAAKLRDGQIEQGYSSAPSLEQLSESMGVCRHAISGPDQSGTLDSLNSMHQCSSQEQTWGRFLTLDGEGSSILMRCDVMVRLRDFCFSISFVESGAYLAPDEVRCVQVLKLL